MKLGSVGLDLVRLLWVLWVNLQGINVGDYLKIIGLRFQPKKVLLLCCHLQIICSKINFTRDFGK